MRKIAALLGKSPNTIAAELRRNAVRGRYDAKKAHHKAYARRKYAKYQGMRIAHCPPLRDFVEDMLMDDCSPEAVASRLRHLPHLPSVSAHTIRRFMASIYGRKIETHRWLKRRRRKQHGKRASLPPRTFIGRRPLYINARRKVGDTEADFIVSGKSGRGILLVVVDRRTRYVFLEHILPVSILHMEQAFLHIKRRFPELRSITADNDILFQHHERLAALLHIRIFSAVRTMPGRKEVWSMRTRSSAGISPREVISPVSLPAASGNWRQSLTGDRWHAFATGRPQRCLHGTGRGLHKTKTRRSAMSESVLIEL